MALTCLIVDDNPFFLESATELLGREGLEVVGVASESIEAIRLASELRPDVTLVDIADFRTAIGEMARVLKPGGSLLVANLTGFTSACANQGWVKDAEGRL